MAKVHKKIVIMGATSGIGLRLAVTLASKGWTVGAAGRKLAVLEKLKSKFPTVVEIEQIDIKEKDAPKKLIRLIRKLGGMDIYFHDSGVGYENVSLEIAEEVNTLETNVVGFARMIATAYHYYRLTGFHGQIAAITSVAGTKGYGPPCVLFLIKEIRTDLSVGPRPAGTPGGSGCGVHRHQTWMGAHSPA